MQSQQYRYQREIIDIALFAIIANPVPILHLEIRYF